MLIIVRGLPGTGKSYFSENFAIALGATYVSSDQVRARLKLRGRYEETVKERVYQEMFKEAKEALQSHHHCLMDATFSKLDRLGAASRLAAAYSVAFFVIEMTADEDTIKDRVSRSRKFSEANVAVYEKIKREYESIQEDFLLLNSSTLSLEAMIKKAKKYLAYDR